MFISMGILLDKEFPLISHPLNGPGDDNARITGYWSRGGTWYYPPWYDSWHMVS